MLLSIITINYNNAADLAKTMASVINQTWKEFEYIVIDGGSTDESVEIIKKHEDDIHYWISEKDNGIYNAMNKGIAVAKGEYLFMLNSGDVLLNESVLQSVFQGNQHTEDIIYGDVKWYSNGNLFREGKFPSRLSFQYFWHKSLGHQAAFIKKSVHQLAGLYDEELKFGSDWKLFVLAICKYNCSYKHLSLIVSSCDCDGLTWRPSNFPAIRMEKEMVLKKEFPVFYDDYKELELLQTQKNRNRTEELKSNLKGTVKKLIGHKKKK